MTATETAGIVSEAITQALNKMACLEAIPFDGEPGMPLAGITVEIHFTGPVNGAVRVIAGMDFARVLAENMSGLDMLTEQECIDAMKELVNVTCGLVLPMIANLPNDVVDVTVPHLTGSERQEYWEEFVGHDDVTVLDVEDFPVAARLIIN